MKKNIGFILLIFISKIAFGQSAQLIYSHCFGGYYDEVFNQVRLDSGRTVYAFGSEASNDGDVTSHFGPAHIPNFWYLKVDVTGNITNQLSFGGSGGDYGLDFLFNPNNLPVFSGTASSLDGQVIGDHPLSGNPGGSTDDYWLFKTDTGSNILWQGCYGGGNEDVLYGMCSSKDGGYLLAGTTNSSDGDVQVLNGVYYNMWVVKADSVGHKIWASCVGATNSSSNQGSSVCELADSSVIFGGDGDSHFTNYHSGGADIQIAKFDKSGSLLWTKCFGGTGIDNCVKLLSDGLNFFIIGLTTSSDGDVTGALGGVDVWIAKIDSGGNKLWDRCYGGSNWDWPNGAVRTSDGGIAFTGFSNSNDGIFVSGTQGGEDIWAAKIDSVGNLQWGKSIGGSSDDEGRSIAEIDPHHYVVCGYSQSSDGDMNINHGGKDAWIGEIEVSPVNVPSVIEASSLLTATYRDENLRVNIASSGQQKISFAVCDILGRIAIDETISLKTGYNDFERHLPNLKGIYIVKVGVSAKKIVVE